MTLMNILNAWTCVLFLGSWALLQVTNPALSLLISFALVAFSRDPSETSTKIHQFMNILFQNLENAAVFAFAILFSAWWRLGRFLTSGLVQFILPVFAQLVSQSYRVFSACAESARTSLAESAQKADEIMNQLAKTQMFQWTVKLTSITTCGLLLMAFIQAPLVLIGLSVILIACIEQVRLTLSILAPTIVTDTLVATPAKSPVVMPSLASVKMPSPVVINIPMTPAALAQTVKEKMFNSDQPSPAPVVAPRGPLTPLRPSIMNSNTMAAVSGKDKTFAAVLAAAKTPKSSGIKRRMVDVTHDIEKENRCPNSDVPIKAWRMRQPGSIEAMAAAYKRKQMIQQQRRSTTMMR